MTASILWMQEFLGHELVEELGLGGQGSETAGDDHAEAAASVADDGAETDIVDRALDAIAVTAAVEGDFEFTGQVLGEFLAEERVGDALGVGADIENLVGGDAGPRAGGDVADGVVAGFAIGEADIGEQVHQVRDLCQGDEVILHVLAGGEVAAGRRRTRRRCGRVVQPGGR